MTHCWNHIDKCKKYVLREPLLLIRTNQRCWKVSSRWNYTKKSPQPRSEMSLSMLKPTRHQSLACICPTGAYQPAADRYSWLTALPSSHSLGIHPTVKENLFLAERHACCCSFPSWSLQERSVWCEAVLSTLSASCFTFMVKSCTFKINMDLNGDMRLKRH